MAKLVIYAPKFKAGTKIASTLKSEDCMMRFLKLVFLIGLVLLPIVGMAAEGDSSKVRLCVALPLNRSYLNTSMKVAQNRLVYNINETTQKKNAKVRVEGIAVEDSDLSGAEADARDKECLYLLMSEFTGLDSVMPGPAGPMEMPAPVIRNRGNGPRAGLHFRVLRVGSSTTLDSGTLGPASGTDEDDAALDLVSLLATRSVHTVLKVRPPNVD
jgi:hypothetical protein